MGNITLKEKGEPTSISFDLGLAGISFASGRGLRKDANECAAAGGLSSSEEAAIVRH
jgi:hypothetical protein